MNNEMKVLKSQTGLYVFYLTYGNYEINGNNREGNRHYSSENPPEIYKLTNQQVTKDFIKLDESLPDLTYEEWNKQRNYLAELEDENKLSFKEAQKLNELRTGYKFERETIQVKTKIEYEIEEQIVSKSRHIRLFQHIGKGYGKRFAQLNTYGFIEEAYPKILSDAKEKYGEIANGLSLAKYEHSQGLWLSYNNKYVIRGEYKTYEDEYLKCIAHAEQLQREIVNAIDYHFIGSQIQINAADMASFLEGIRSSIVKLPVSKKFQPELNRIAVSLRDKISTLKLTIKEKVD